MSTLTEKKVLLEDPPLKGKLREAVKDIFLKALATKNIINTYKTAYNTTLTA